MTFPQTLPDVPSEDPEQYSVIISNSTYALSFADAFRTFLLQMGTGHVGVTVICDEASDSIDLDDILTEAPDAQINLGLDLIARQIRNSSSHERLVIMHRVNEAIAKAVETPPRK